MLNDDTGPMGGQVKMRRLPDAGGAAARPQHPSGDSRKLPQEIKRRHLTQEVEQHVHCMRGGDTGTMAQQMKKQLPDAGGAAARPPHPSRLQGRTRLTRAVQPAAAAEGLSQRPAGQEPGRVLLSWCRSPA